MNKQRTNFFESHIEKIVFAVVGILCIWILISRVLVSPNYIEYDRKKFGTGGIDDYILIQAEELEDRLNRKTEPKESYKPRLKEFNALFDSTIQEIDFSLVLPQPKAVGKQDVKRQYNIPAVGPLMDVQVGHIRAVAYVPTEPVGEKTYEAVGHEAKDIDFVTVEAKFDIKELCEDFYECFAGYNVEPEWRDPCMAKPIFAALDLQRKHLLPDESWSDWQRVLRSRIDHRKEMFGIIEQVDDLPASGVKLRLLQYGNPVVASDLLQPNGYRIASANEEWFPPSYHSEYLKLQKELDVRQKRKVRDAERQERQNERKAARAGKMSSQRSSLATMEGEGGGSEYESTSSRSKSSTRRSRLERRSEKQERPNPKAKEPTRKISDIYDEFENVLITDETVFSQMDEPLLVWANDDNIKAGNAYRYRIRIGVFNPIAGTDQFSEEAKSMKNRAILWSKFTESSETVRIPAMQYFFPRSLQEAAETVTVQVSKYVLGHWYSKDFAANKGEDIGRITEIDVKNEQDGIKNTTAPKEIDYRTGVVLVDVLPVNDWSGNRGLRARQYYNMLYSFNGAGIEQMPIKNKYWSEELQLRFSEIKRAGKEPIEPLRNWNNKRKGEFGDGTGSELSDDELLQMLSEG